MTARVTGRSPAPVGYAQAHAALTAAQKPARGVSLYSSRVNRPLGRRLAALAYVLGLSPNAVTLLSGAVSAAGALALALVEPSWPLGVAVALALALGFALDAADGQLARLTARTGPAGEWLDHVVDAAVKLLLHGCVAVAWYRFEDRGAGLLLPLGFAAAAVLLFVAGTLAELLLRGRPGAAAAPPRPASTASGLLLLPADFGATALVFLLWGAQDAFAVVYAALLACYAMLLVGLGARWFRQLSGGPG